MPSARSTTLATESRALRIGVGILALLALAGCHRPAATDREYDPVALARATRGVVDNREAVVPPQCYTRTDGTANPCWTCHTSANGRNGMDDAALQEQYAFSDAGRTNHWTGLFVDRRPAMAKISDAEAEAWTRSDNYAPLRAALAARADFLGWRPDHDYAAGYDAGGFARDGSGWRAFRYQPFPGTFWPTNGSSDDVLIRLPEAFRRDADGRTSDAIYRANLAVLEAAMAVADTRADGALGRRVEAIDERSLGVDLDGDGRLGTATRIERLPARYFGSAKDIAVERYAYPVGTEFLHTLRYLDPAQPGFRAQRIRELRYAIKRARLDEAAQRFQYEEARRDKALGLLPWFRGEPEVGYLNDFGWQFQGYIEDARGRLRVQTTEEQQYCLGCHGTIGITVDQSFSFPRKLPGADGWQMQRLDGLQDRPQAGQREPEALTYLRRTGGGDEFRANTEMLARFFPRGLLDDTEVRRAAVGGDRDLAWLLLPSPERARALTKATMTLVAAQDFAHGRDALPAPAVNVHREIANGETALKAAGHVYRDGRLWLDWDWPAARR